MNCLWKLFLSHILKLVALIQKSSWVRIFHQSCCLIKTIHFHWCFTGKLVTHIVFFLFFIHMTLAFGKILIKITPIQNSYLSLGSNRTTHSGKITSKSIGVGFFAWKSYPGQIEDCNHFDLLTESGIFITDK